MLLWVGVQMLTKFGHPQFLNPFTEEKEAQCAGLQTYWKPEEGVEEVEEKRVYPIH